MLTLWRCKFFINKSMTSKVIEGHKRYFFVFKSQLFLTYLFCLTFNLNQILYKWLHNKDTFFHNMMFDLNWPYIHPMPLYLFSLSHSSPLFLFISSPRPSPPLHQPYIHPMPHYLFSLPRSSSLFFLTLNYVLMDSFMSLLKKELNLRNLQILQKS